MNATFLLGLLCTLAAIGAIFLLAALALNARRKMPTPLEPGWDEPDTEPVCHKECLNNDPPCWAKHSGSGYICTRDKGHLGQHVACISGEHAVQVWDDITPVPAIGRWDLPTKGNL